MDTHTETPIKRTGIIHDVPKKIKYKEPKSIGNGYTLGEIKDRVHKKEILPNGIYYRILDLVEWENPKIVEIRFGYFFCSKEDGQKHGNDPKETDKVWVYGQGAGHMSKETFAYLISKAKEKETFKSFFADIQVNATK